MLFTVINQEGMGSDHQWRVNIRKWLFSFVYGVLKVARGCLCQSHNAALIELKDFVFVNK
jgi:hypothetical protein